MTDALWNVIAVSGKGKITRMSFSEQQFDSALARFLSETHNPKNDRVDLVMDATGQHFQSPQYHADWLNEVDAPA